MGEEMQGGNSWEAENLLSRHNNALDNQYNQKQKAQKKTHPLAIIKKFEGSITITE
jgi:hypothetical protein